MIEFLIGGSPCTHWSIAQSKNRETTAEGIGWELFKNYLIAKEKFKPDFFLYENNKSAATAIKEQISIELDAPLQYINSALVSAQNRQRFYVHNFGEVHQPEDRGIILHDILQPTFQEGKIWCNEPTEDALKTYNQATACRCRGRKNNNGNGCARYECRTDGKANTLDTNTTNGAMVAELVPCVVKMIKEIVDEKGYLPTVFNPYNRAEIKDKHPTLTASMGRQTSSASVFTVEAWDGKIYPVYEVLGGEITIKGDTYPIKLADGLYIIRRLTVTEACRLQTLPDDYCRAVSATQAYKGLGNGWTAEVIIHLLSHALVGVPKNEEIVVLSMYDGIGTGRYCFDRLGYKNVTYYAYEIDKYAVQIATSNYGDIIQCGDAFGVREDGWRLPKR